MASATPTPPYIKALEQAARAAIAREDSARGSGCTRSANAGTSALEVSMRPTARTALQVNVREEPSYTVHAQEVTPSRTVRFLIRTPNGREWAIPVKKKPDAATKKRMDELYAKIQDGKLEYEIDLWGRTETYLNTGTGLKITQPIGDDDWRCGIIEELRDLYGEMLGKKDPIRWPRYDAGSRGNTSEPTPFFQRHGDAQLMALKSDNAILEKALGNPLPPDSLRQIEVQRALRDAWRRAVQERLGAQSRVEQEHPNPTTVGESPRLQALRLANEQLEQIDSFALDMGGLPLDLTRSAPNQAAEKVMERAHLIAKAIREQLGPREGLLRRKHKAPEELLMKYALDIALLGVHDRFLYEKVIAHPGIHDKSKADPVELGLARAARTEGLIDWSQLPPFGAMLSAMAPEDRAAILAAVSTPPAQPAADGSP